MSYGISLVINNIKDNENIPFIFIGGFDGMYWRLAKAETSPERVIQRLNNDCKNYLKNPDGISNLNNLLTAPIDEIIIIKSESTYESMKNRKPIDGKNVDLLKYLTKKEM